MLRDAIANESISCKITAIICAQNRAPVRVARLGEYLNPRGKKWENLGRAPVVFLGIAERKAEGGKVP